MPDRSSNKQEICYSCIVKEISELKKKGLNTLDIINDLTKYYPYRDILEFLAGNKYIVRSVITEKLVVVDAKNNYLERDGLLVLKELIDEIAKEPVY